MSKTDFQNHMTSFEPLKFSEDPEIRAQEMIYASIGNLQKEIEYHLNRSSQPQETRQLYLEQIEKLLARLRKKEPRRLGVLKGKANYKIKSNFKMTDEELISS